MANRRIRITLEYLGTRYAGWQMQKNGVSIQQVVEEALEKLTGRFVRVTGSGRTDAGVHALAQTAHADVETRMTDDALLRGLNSLLPEDIAAKEVATVPADFHARFSAKAKTYQYTILNRREPSVFGHGREWHVVAPLDVDAMRRAAKLLKGRHDFTSFQSAGRPVKDAVRNVTRLNVERNGDRIVITVTADGFLKQMVRNIAGTLVEIGRGKLPPDSIKAIFEAKDRKSAGPCAPAGGLALVDVTYGGSGPERP